MLAHGWISHPYSISHILVDTYSLFLFVYWARTAKHTAIMVIKSICHLSLRWEPKHSLPSSDHAYNEWFCKMHNSPGCAFHSFRVLRGVNGSQEKKATDNMNKARCRHIMGSWINSCNSPSKTTKNSTENHLFGSVQLNCGQQQTNMTCFISALQFFSSRGLNLVSQNHD